MLNVNNEFVTIVLNAPAEGSVLRTDHLAPIVNESWIFFFHFSTDLICSCHSRNYIYYWFFGIDYKIHSINAFYYNILSTHSQFLPMDFK